MNSEALLRARRAPRYGRCALLLALALPFASAAIDDPREQLWKTVEQMSEEDRARFDPATSTPRDTTLPYIPAEAYPFQAPYTAEEMGYRSSEFVHTPRWQSGMVDAFGVVTSSGYINQGMTVIYTRLAGRPGLEGYIHDLKPGEPYQHWISYDIFPPESEAAQQLWIPYRTDKEHKTKLDYYFYSESLRRVRRQPQPIRDQRFPDNSQTFDDVTGRDPWELQWQLLGTDVLYETARYPNTRPTITHNIKGQFIERQTAAIKMMGEQYKYYRADGGIDCYVLKATVREDWLPGYREKTYVFWIDKHHFYPLRMEKYSPTGKLMMVEARIAELENSERGEFGFAAHTTVYWNVEYDLISYSMHDGQVPRVWTDEQKRTMFTPEFMRRRWLIEPLKSLVVVRDPAQFFLRPKIYPGKFSGERNWTLPAEIQARVDAQEAAGHLVFVSSEGAATAQKEAVAGQ